MNCRKTTLVRAGSKASLARRPWGTVNTHWRTGTCGITRSAIPAAKSHILLPTQLTQKPRRLHEKATGRHRPQSVHFAKIRPFAKIPQRKNASTSAMT